MFRRHELRIFCEGKEEGGLSIGVDEESAHVVWLWFGKAKNEYSLVSWMERFCTQIP